MLFRSLYELCTEHRLLDCVLGDKTEQSQRTKLGNALSRKRDTVIENYRIVGVVKDHSGRQKYKLEQTTNSVQVVQSETKPLDVMVKLPDVHRDRTANDTVTAHNTVRKMEDLMNQMEWVA